MDTTKNFDGYAKDYTAGRPNYAAQLIDSIFLKKEIQDIRNIWMLSAKLLTGIQVMGLLRWGIHPSHI